MRHPRTMPDQFRRIMLTIVDPSSLEQFGRGTDCAEARQMFDAVNNDRPGKTLRFERRKASLAHHTLGRIGIAGFEDQSVETARAFEQVLANLIRAGWQTEQFHIV